MKLKDLREARGKLVAEARALLETADKENRAQTNEEKAKYDTMYAEIERMGARIAQEERQQELEREEAERVARDREERGDRTQDNDQSPSNTDWAKGLENRAGKIPEYIRALQKRTGPTASAEYRSAFNQFLQGGNQSLNAEHKRALAAGAGTEGGYLIAPPAFIATLLKNIDDMLWIRQVATQVPVTGSEEIGVPTLDADPADADWTTELGTGSEDSTMAFGKRKMEAHPLAKRIKVSRKLLRLSALGAEQLVIQRLTYKFYLTLEKAYLTGSGVEKPLGIFTASNDGVPTTRDISTGNDTIGLTFDGIIEAKYNLKAAYWPSARWLFHRTVVKDISKLKDNDGQYLWRPSVREGEPDTILGHPLMVSEYAPNTMTTGQYVGMFADFSKYWFLDSFNFEIQRLDELYAETNQVGFIGRYEGDGAPVLAEGFSRLKLA